MWAASRFAVAIALAVAAVVWELWEPRSSILPPPVFAHVPVHLDDEAGALLRFTKGLRFATVSDRQSPQHLADIDAIKGLHSHIEASFPLVHKRLKRRTVNDWSLLYTWKGTNSSLKPVLCISHLDVVPVTSEDAWTHPPFSGVVKDGFIWGRGAQDVKITVFAMLEAVTALLKQGLAPQRTVLLAFGHDEEVGGTRGALAIAGLLAAEGTQLEYVLDEGSPLLADGLAPFMTDRAVALVGTAEKGFVSVDLMIEGKGGHSSLPPQDGSQAVSRLARVLTALDRAPPAAKLVPPTLDFLLGMGAVSSNSLLRWLLRRSGQWPFRQALAFVIGRQPGELASAVRTTVVPTGISSFPAAGNVIPSLASAHFNFRYLPGEAEGFAMDHLRSFLESDSGHGNATLTVNERFEMASPVTAIDSPAFQVVQQAILETLAHDRAVAVLPFLLTGGTDSKHYQGLCNGQTIRFIPVAMNRTAGDVGRVHGIDERVSVEAFLDAVRFYVRFIQLATGA